MAKQHPIEKELADLLEIKRDRKDTDTTFAKKLHEAAVECDKSVWEQLSEEAQGWVNSATDASEAGKALPDYDLGGDSEPEPEPDEPEEAPKKGARGKKASAKEEKKAPAKAASKTPEKAPAKGAKKAAEKAPAKGKARAKSNGKAAPKAAKTGQRGSKENPGMTPEWAAVLRDVGKKGAKGVTSADMETLCEKHGTRPYYNRFINAGYLERIGRGQFAITKAGEKAAAA